jgi:hypothetical protein
VTVERVISSQEGVLTEETVHTEEFRVSGDDLLARVKELLREGNIRRLTIKDRDGRTRFDLPLPIAVAGALVKPKLAVLAAMVAVFTHGSIVVERVAAQSQET